MRKDFRINWDLRRAGGLGPVEPRKTVEVSADRVSEATDLYLRTLAQIWDWRTEEHGGSEAVAESFRMGIDRGEKWFLCMSDNEPAGLTGMIPDFYQPGWARFRGAYVDPGHRGRRVGLSVMSEAMRLSRSMGQSWMTVYTFSYLDRLSPGASLYLRSGGKVDAESVQLQMPSIVSPR